MKGKLYYIIVSVIDMARKIEDLEIIEAFSTTFDKFLNDNKYTNYNATGYYGLLDSSTNNFKIIKILSQ